MAALDTVAPLSPDLLPAALALNNDHAAELSLLDDARFRQLVAWSWYSAVIGPADALILTFDPSSPYDSPNFRWFQSHYPRFVYVDRVVVAPRARGRGLARRLYNAVFEKARAENLPMVTCEINLDPPNPGSEAFHAAMGFSAVGDATPNGKAVRYFTKAL
ncbi:MAG: GNAT family N-acetyltransferase [Rhizobiaceae bacterium]|nr:GNAT family N-acetyltransferase [Rhizobiaceae bacterium]